MTFKGMARRIAGVGAALAAVGAMLIAPGSAGAAPVSVTADPSTPFEVVYGATIGSGTIRWHQRSVDVDYTLKASYCRRLYAFAYDRTGFERSKRSTSLHCNDISSDSWNLPVDVAGGPGWVHICLADQDDHFVVCNEYKVP
ncbi:hypothetical protein [Lentzea sp.]|uniref:hypothetical protein n=1 Tax=Lentzea sp. TaxID=56099 RepID=UPI002B92A58F|nr:hypothetical protein [Lentzea sp.]HUQ59439.1 hypothetical protein [Lentzea sp.]